MAAAQVLSRAQLGFDAPPVRVEVHLGSGLPSFSIVGLPAPVVRESKERVRAALAHCGYEFPAGRITVNLSPADLPKEGGRFDLPIAVGVLVASGQLRPKTDLSTVEFYGELGLTGELKPVAALLPAVLRGAAAGRELCVPRESAAALSLAQEARLRPAADLDAVCRWLRGGSPDEAPADSGSVRATARDAGPRQAGPDLADVRGQWQARRALAIAAAGGHSLLFVGSPGSGKSLLAQRLPGLLPPLQQGEALEVAAIHSVSGSDWLRQGVDRPFRAPHHTASAQAVIGGGRDARPGEISLAHGGVLFLDELPEFDRRVLEALREPLETARVNVSRTQFRVDYPADCMFVAAMNPCPCGFHGDPSRRCCCAPQQLRRYRDRISGPLLDRLDLLVEMRRVDLGVAGGQDPPPPGCAGLGSTREAAATIAEARRRQGARQSCLNARLGPAETLDRCKPDAPAILLLARASERLALSARVYHRVLRVARSIADLAGRDVIGHADVAEALSMRVAPVLQSEVM
jgi:magnesium chelatase family protein